MRREDFSEFAAFGPAYPLTKNPIDEVLSRLPAWIQSYYGVGMCPDDREVKEKHRLFKLRYLDCAGNLCRYSLAEIEKIEDGWKIARNNPPPMIKIRA